LRAAFLSALDSAQRRLVETQAQVASGKRVNNPSDDPLAAARIAHLDASLARLDQYQANGVIARNQLGLEENSLGAAIDNLQSVKELVVQANNSTISSSDRQVIANELRQRRDALLTLANNTDSDGRYLFGGYSENGAPFSVAAGGNVVYNGDQGQRTLQISDTRFVAINDSGAQVFQNIPNGNGTFAIAANVANTGTGTLGAGTVIDAAAWVDDSYTVTFTSATAYEVRDSGNALVGSGSFVPPAQSVQFRGANVQIDGTPAVGDRFSVVPSSRSDVFATLDGLIAALEAPASDAASNALLHSRVGQGMGDLDQALSHVIDTRAQIGARVRALDQEATLGEDFSVHLQTTLSSIRDLDYPEAMSRLSQQLFGIDVAQKSYARMQGLSLFQYL
jgi:flagellar hook-associated protein 3 FlgL